MSTHETTPEQLGNSETYYRRVFEAACFGIIILNAVTLRITDANPFIIEFLGYSNDDFLGKELWEIVCASVVPIFKSALHDLQKTGSLHLEDVPLNANDGNIRQVDIVGKSIEIEGKQVIQFNIRDITDRKLADEVFSESEARYRTLFEYAPDGHSRKVREVLEY